jgi:hypothetical protein
LIDHGILARSLNAAHEATAAALVSSALLLVVSLVVAGVRLGVAIASHLAFEGLLAFAEETVHVGRWWIEELEVSRRECCGEQGEMIVKMGNEFIRASS